MPITKDRSLSLLFATFPPLGGDRAAQLEAYMRAVEVYDAGDIEEAVNRFLRGQVDWHNQSFAPSAAMLGSEAKRLRDARLESAARERRMRPALPPPDIEKTPEQRAKAAEMVKNFVASVSPDVVDADAALRSKSQWAKVNARFMPEQTEEAIRQRLMRTPYTTGSPESERESA